MADLSEPLYTPSEAVALAEDARGHDAFAPWGDTPLLLIDARAEALPDNEDAALAGWLAGLPCPAVAVGVSDAARHVRAWVRACDLAVADENAVAVVAQGIRSRPLSAAVFVRLLRGIDGLALEPALAAESLAYATLQSGPDHQQWLASHQPAPAVQAGNAPPVLTERHGGMLRLTLNRPERGNAMSVEMRDALLDALRGPAADPGVAAVHVSGRGTCFSTGGDLDEFGTVPDPVTGHLVRGLALPGRALAACAAHTTALVHGTCIGSGIEFPAFAGRVVARPGAWFELPELRFGLIPGAGGCVSIPRRIGRHRTAWMVLTGTPIDAATALQWGLVDAIE